MQFVTFKLGEEYFAIDTRRVQSINEMITITKVPKAPKHIKGLINLRGSIKPLVDIRMLLNIEDDYESENIIIVQLGNEEVGIAVDEVVEVLDIEKDKFQAVSNKSKEYILGVIELSEDIITIPILQIDTAP